MWLCSSNLISRRSHATVLWLKYTTSPTINHKLTSHSQAIKKSFIHSQKVTKLQSNKLPPTFIYHPINIDKPHGITNNRKIYISSVSINYLQLNSFSHKKKKITNKTSSKKLCLDSYFFSLLLLSSLLYLFI